MVYGIRRIMMKKKMILFLLLLLLSGCSSEYNLKITSDNIEENIHLVIEKSAIENQVISDEVEPDDQITPFLEDDQYPIWGDYYHTYDKEVTEDDNNYYMEMNYTFKPDEYGNSTAIHKCFEKMEYINKEDYYEIKLGGTFYCLYGTTLEINVKTPNLVKKHNADKHKGNTYTWIINAENADDTNISIKVMKKTKFSHYSAIVLVTTLLFIVAFGIFIVIKKLFDRKRINEI